MPDVRGGNQTRNADELIRCARITEISLRNASQDVAQQVAAQGRPDAMESVVGSNSLARGAAEIAHLIRQVQATQESPVGKG